MKRRRHFDKAATVMESDYHAWGLLFSCYQAQNDEEGMRHAARDGRQAGRKSARRGPLQWSGAKPWRRRALPYWAKPSVASEWIDRALLLDPDNLNMRYNFACILAATFDDLDRAVEMLAPVLSRAPRGMIQLAQTDRDLDKVRDDPRFQKMLAAAEERTGLGGPATPPAAAAAPPRS